MEVAVGAGRAGHKRTGATGMRSSSLVLWSHSQFGTPAGRRDHVAGVVYFVLPRLAKSHQNRSCAHNFTPALRTSSTTTTTIYIYIYIHIYTGYIYIYRCVCVCYIYMYIYILQYIYIYILYTPDKSTYNIPSLLFPYAGLTYYFPIECLSHPINSYMTTLGKWPSF